MNNNKLFSIGLKDSYHTLGDQVIVDRLAQLQLPARAEALRNDLHTLDVQVRQLQEALDSLSRLQQRLAIMNGKSFYSIDSLSSSIDRVSCMACSSTNTRSSLVGHFVSH